MDLFIEMGLPMFESQVKESQSRVAPLIFAQAGVGACVDPTRSTDRRDSLLNGRKM